MGAGLENVGIMILAGGRGNRMGGVDKGWCLYQQRPMICQVITMLTRHLESMKLQPRVVISANRNLARYRALGLPTIKDSRKGYCGPLSGIESVLRADETRQNPVERWLVIPVDSPELSIETLIEMLSLRGEEIGYLNENGRRHFAHLSFPADQLDSVTEYLDAGRSSIKGWLAERSQVVEIETSMILNLNRPFPPLKSVV